MKIADQLCERSKEYYRQDNSSDYAYITAEEFNPAQVVQMEKTILSVVDFSIIEVTAQSYMRSHFPERDVLSVVLSDYLADISLLNLELRFQFT